MADDPLMLPAVPADVSYEVELDDPPDTRPVLVDPAPPPAELRPVIPPQLRAAVARAAGRNLHRAKYHGFRSGWYLLQALAWAIVGVLRLGARHAGWWSVRDARRLEAQLAVSGDDKGWHKVHEQVRETARIRGWISLAGAVALLIAGSLLYHFGRWWAWALLAIFVVPVLARIGRPADKPIIRPAVVTPRFRRLNADIVLRAYYAAGLGHPDKAGMQVTFGSTMARDGEGTRVLVDLPYGKGLDDAVKAKPGIASGLDVTESQVFIRRDPTSHRRHTLWVADRDPLAVPVGRTPLLACRATDIWRPAPLGLDERGTLVTVPLMWNSVLVGALPRQGKTFSARLLALYAALDPYVQMSVFDAKGSPDWRKFALVADSCAFGLTPTRDGIPAEILAGTLTGIRDDVQQRYQRLSELPLSVCPEGKLTRDIARDPRYGMPVRLIVLEEFQEYYDLGTDLAKEIAQMITFLVKVAPGAGVIVLASTQKPSGIGGGGIVATQFTSARDQFQVRFSLRTSSYTVSDMVLGQGAYSEGLDSSALLPQYKGVGILRGATDASPTVRTFLADGQDAEKILTAARALRERAGTLSGMAAGDEVTRQARDVLADVLAVFAGEPGLHWQAVAERLALRFPDRWADASADAVSAQCRSLGVESVDVKSAGRTRMGCRRRDVETAARQ